MEASNVKAMREALVKIRKLVTDDRPADEVEIANICNIALSAPPCNSDVGTAEEQVKRFEEFCDDSQVDEDYTSMCARCTLRREKHCELAWAQMPYEEGGAK